MPAPDPLEELAAALLPITRGHRLSRLRPRVIGRFHPVHRVRRRRDPLVSHRCRHQLVSLTADQITHCPHRRADRRGPGFAVTAATGSCQ